LISANVFAVRPNARPPRRREEVRDRILRGWERDRIAKDLGMSVDTVRVHTREILRQERVKSVEAMREVYRDRVGGGEVGREGAQCAARRELSADRVERAE